MRAYCSLRRLFGRGGSGGVTGALSPGEGGAREGGALGAELALGRSGGAATIGDVDEAKITGGMPGAGGAIVSYCRTWRPCKNKAMDSVARRSAVELTCHLMSRGGEAMSLSWRMPGSARIKSKMIWQTARRCSDVRRSAWRSDASAAIW